MSGPGSRLRSYGGATVLATFVLTEPGLLVAALAALVIAWAWARRGRQTIRALAPATAREPAGESGTYPAASAAHPESRLTGVLIALALGAGALGLGTVLAVVGTSGAHVLLLTLCGIAAFGLSVESYLGLRAKLSSGRAAVCLLARLSAWLAVLTVIGQPSWAWVVVRWEKPLLTVLLDQSNSMSISDREGPDELTRAALVNQAIAEARPSIERLDNHYEVRTLDVGESVKSRVEWRILPHASVSAIATALRHAGQSRSLHGEPPLATLLISDGAENAVNPRVVGEVASELASQRTALLAVGVGPEAGLSPAIVLDRLAVPLRVGARDHVHVPVIGQVTGCAGRQVELGILWDDQLVDRHTMPIEHAAQRISAEFDVQPPGPGLHRLTARATPPAALGGESVETSAVVDVSSDLIQVLILGGQPHNELAFATRALRGEPRFEVIPQLLLRNGAEQPLHAASGDLRWSEYDVVIFGRVPEEQLSYKSLQGLADAIRQRGVGLLLVGGRQFYHGGYYSRSALQDISPVEFTRTGPADDYRPRFLPTDIGHRHPILLGVDEGLAARRQNSQAAYVWDRLPALHGAARLGEPKPLTAILATDSAGQPLLTALDVGRGRCIAAGWESTWSWALSSSEGSAIHRRLWRQMVAWLANRRPVAWVVTGRSRYVRAALEGGQQSIRVRAGLSGLDTLGGQVGLEQFKAGLHLRQVQAIVVPQTTPSEVSPSTMAASQPTTVPTEQRWTVPLKRRENEWYAELPRDLQAQAWLTGGVYELEFIVEQSEAGNSVEATSAASASGEKPLTLSARTGFEIAVIDLELQKPTANLALLRKAAGCTKSAGGDYCEIDQLPGLVRRLAEHDRRRRIERNEAYHLTERQPWALLTLIVAALTLDWAVRKRGGMP